MKKQFFTAFMILLMVCITWSICYGEDNVIFGCYHKNNGQLRIVSDHSECRPSELPISLSGTTQPCPENPLPHFEGVLCWNVEWEERPNYVMKLRVTYMGGTSYIVQSEQENIEHHFGAWFGTALIVGDEIRISVHETHSDDQPLPFENADHGGSQFFLDSTTLNGQGWCTTAYYDPSTGSSGVDYSTGTLTFVECP